MRIERRQLESTVAGEDAWRRIVAHVRRQFLFATAIVGLFWLTVVVITAVTFSLRAHEDTERQKASAAVPPAAAATATPTPGRPAGVPASAQTVRGDLVLGDPGDALHFFRDLDCHDDLMTIGTTKTTVYAVLPCARALPSATVSRLVGQPVRMRISGERLTIESLFVGGFQFDTQGIWLVTR